MKIKIYKSFLEADDDLNRYCQNNLENELLAERRLSKIPEEVNIEGSNLCVDLTFNYIVGLFSPRSGPKYDSIMGLDYTTSHASVSPAGISIDALVKNVRKFLDKEHRQTYGKVGARMKPIFYTIEKDPSIFRSLKRFNKLRKEGESLIGAAIVEFWLQGLNKQEREEFSELWR